MLEQEEVTYSIEFILESIRNQILSPAEDPEDYLQMYANNFGFSVERYENIEEFLPSEALERHSDFLEQLYFIFQNDLGFIFDPESIPLSFFNIYSFYHTMVLYPNKIISIALYVFREYQTADPILQDENYHAAFMKKMSILENDDVVNGESLLEAFPYFPIKTTYDECIIKHILFIIFDNEVLLPYLRKIFIIRINDVQMSYELIENNKELISKL